MLITKRYLIPALFAKRNELEIEMILSRIQFDTSKIAWRYWDISCATCPTCYDRFLLGKIFYTRETISFVFWRPLSSLIGLQANENAVSDGEFLLVENGLNLKNAFFCQFLQLLQKRKY